MAYFYSHFYDPNEDLFWYHPNPLWIPCYSTLLNPPEDEDDDFTIMCDSGVMVMMPPVQVYTSGCLEGYVSNFFKYSSLFRVLVKIYWVFFPLFLKPSFKNFAVKFTVIMVWLFCKSLYHLMHTYFPGIFQKLDF